MNTCALLISMMAACTAKLVYAVELNPGIYAEWYDRLANLPGCAQEFNAWLLEKTDGDGIKDAMIDPTKATRLSNGGNTVYVYEITSMC